MISKKFCNQNNISINLYIINDETIQPYLTCSRDEKKSDHVNLLLLENNVSAHYVYINNLSRLIRDQLTKNKNQHYICDRCFYYTSSINIFNRHIDLCDNYFNNEKAIPILPDENNNILKFKNIHKTIRVPLVYYADLEAVLKKLDNKKLQALWKHKCIPCNRIITKLIMKKLNFI